MVMFDYILVVLSPTLALSVVSITLWPGGP